MKSHALLRMNCTSSLWFNGTLFLSTHTDIRAVFPHNAGVHSVILGSTSHQSEEATDGNLVTSLTQGADWLTPPLQGLPSAVGSLLCVVNGTLVIAGTGGVLSTLQLHSPCMRMLLLLAAGQPVRALEWANKALHIKTHDTIGKVRITILIDFFLTFLLQSLLYSILHKPISS